MKKFLRSYRVAGLVAVVAGALAITTAQSGAQCVNPYCPSTSTSGTSTSTTTTTTTTTNTSTSTSTSTSTTTTTTTKRHHRKHKHIKRCPRGKVRRHGKCVKPRVRGI